MENTGLIGGDFKVCPNPKFIEERGAYFDARWAEREAQIAAMPDQAISITLPNGDVKPGFAFKTSPLDIATSISKVIFIIKNNITFFL